MNEYIDKFSERVLRIVSSIPKGKVLTYQQVAILAGSPKACRAVGSVMRKNYDKNIPCHRVIKANGKAGAYNRGAQEKIRLLKAEGVKTFLRE